MPAPTGRLAQRLLDLGGVLVIQDLVGLEVARAQRMVRTEL